MKRQDLETTDLINMNPELQALWMPENDFGYEPIPIVGFRLHPDGKCEALTLLGPCEAILDSRTNQVFSGGVLLGLTEWEFKNKVKMWL